jgi:predicted O-linked N-acetylglucosamine transferase (SPINDLY family)
MQCYEQGLAIDGGNNYLLGLSIFNKNFICNWDEYKAEIAHLKDQVLQDKALVDPFISLSLSDSNTFHLKAAQQYITNQFPAQETLGVIARHARKDKIHIAYFSADFHEHATAYLMADLFESHDRSRFYISAFSFGPASGDPMRQRLVAAFDEFIDVSSLDDEAIARLVRSKQVDIAIDLKGFTQHRRTGIFAYRAAPIQVNYLGYPGTMGADYMDYVIADEIVLPVSAQSFYSEKIVYLPNSYQPNDRQREVSKKRFARAELGLPESAFVFACFNNNFKLNPMVMDSWARILQAVPGSVLWLLEDNQYAASNLRIEMKKRRVDPSRLIFAPRMPLSEHLSRQREANLFIDTWPYNAHTTASDALWIGLPVLTYMGESFASRVAASLLHAIGLSELATKSQVQYEALAIELALTPRKIKIFREKLLSNRLQAALFDTELFTSHIETAYQSMYEQYQQDMPPKNIIVSPR